MKSIAIVFLLIYFAFLLYLSLRNRKIEKSEDYFLAGRSFSKWALAITFLASWFGGSAILISSNKAFELGIGAFWITAGPNFLAPLLLIFFAVMIRNLNVISQIKIMDIRYNKTIGVFLAIIVVWYMITWAASQMVALAQFFSSYLGFSYVGALMFGVIIVLIYSTLSGFKGVVLTDIAQFWLLLIATIIVSFVSIKAAGGIGNVITILNEKTASSGIQYFNLFENFGEHVMYVITFGLGWMISADAWQRINATKNSKDAKNMLLIVGIIFIPLGFLSIFAGLAAASMWDKLPEGGVVSSIATTMVNPWVSGIIFLGIGAALMSSIDTAINTGSLTLTEDIYRKVINPKGSNTKIVKAGMVTTVIISLLSMFIAIKLRSIIWVLWMASDIIVCGAFCPLVFGFLWKRGNSKGALSSMIGGSAFVLYNTFADLGLNLPTPWPAWPYRILVGLAIAAILYFGVSILTEPEYEKVDKFMKKARGMTIKTNTDISASN